MIISIRLSFVVITSNPKMLMPFKYLILVHMANVGRQEVSAHHNHSDNRGFISILASTVSRVARREHAKHTQSLDSIQK